eukprot:724863-Lingulodinium_polyedra.AAC.1
MPPEEGDPAYSSRGVKASGFVTELPLGLPPALHQMFEIRNHPAWFPDEPPTAVLQIPGPDARL